MATFRTIVTKLRWAGHAARMGKAMSAYKILIGKPSGGNRPLRRAGCTWKDNIRKDIKEIGVNMKSLIDSTRNSINEEPETMELRVS